MGGVIHPSCGCSHGYGQPICPSASPPLPPSPPPPPTPPPLPSPPPAPNCTMCYKFIVSHIAGEAPGSLPCPTKSSCDALATHMTNGGWGAGKSHNSPCLQSHISCCLPHTLSCESMQDPSQPGPSHAMPPMMPVALSLSAPAIAFPKTNYATPPTTLATWRLGFRACTRSVHAWVHDHGSYTACGTTWAAVC